MSREPLSFAGVRQRPEGAIQAAVLDEELARFNLGGCSQSDHPSNRPSYHPATRVLVEIRLRRGFLPRKARRGLTLPGLLAAFRSHGYWIFRNCYETTARSTPDPGGRSTVRVTLDARGRVRASRLLGTRLVHRAIATCFAEQIHRITTPTTGRRLDVDVMISVWPGDAPLPSEPRATPEPAPLDLQQAQSALDTPLAAVEGCLAEARQHDPRLWGRLALDLTVDPDGRVSNVAQAESRFPDPKAVTCATQVFDGLHLPAPTTGTTLRVAVRLLPDPAPTTPQNDAASLQDSGWVDRDSNPGPTD